MTALHAALLVEGKAAGIARQLLEHGARVNAQDKVCRWALGLSCWHYSFKKIGILHDRMGLRR